ncbi:MAG: hypothetical protein R2825_09885 [Saprospiraceae bacterium]
MNNAEIKLELFRLIDNQEGNVLKDLYELITEKLKAKKMPSPISNLDSGYEAMANDMSRENEALEWIEGTANFQEL